jgi:RHS repeat-associated protein
MCESFTTGLYYYRARYYDPGRGRFITADPIGLAGGDTNAFAYVRNGPARFVDPLGLSPAGWLIRLTKSGYQTVGPLASKAAAVEARKAGENVLAETRQMAKAIERANAGGAPVERHVGHDLADGAKGMPHYQTPGMPGHTFWMGILGLLDSMLADLLNPLDAISGELDSSIEEDYLRSVMGRRK